MTREWTFTIDWTRPPLTENQRLHWAQKKNLVKQVRAVAFHHSRGIPALERCEVELVWVVTDKRRRDVDNIVPTFKALCDGLVDGDVVPDDTPEFMVKRMPSIRLEQGGRARFELTVREVS